MWQRFSERARKVIFHAQEEAQKFGDGYVSPELLLLGIIRDPDSEACRALGRLGMSLNRIREEVEKQLPRRDARPSADMTLTPSTMRCINLAYDEARHLGDDYIGTEHLLLGVIREELSLAAQILRKMGLGVDETRRVVLRLRSKTTGGEEKIGPVSLSERESEKLLNLKDASVHPSVAVLLMALADPRSSLVKLLNSVQLWPRDIQCIFENSLLDGQPPAGPTLDKCLAAAMDLARERGASTPTSADMFIAFVAANDSWSIGEYLTANDCDLAEMKKALKNLTPNN